MPAETAAAMADIANYERDVGRAHPDYFLESLARMDEARAGVAAVLGTDVGAVGLTHSTTDAMNAATLAPRLARRRARRDDARTNIPGGVGPLYALRDRNGVDLVVRRRRRRRRRRADPRRVRGRHHARTPAWSRSRTSCGRPGRSCRSRGSPRSRTTGARSSSSTARRPPARSRSVFEDLGRGPVRALRPEMAARAGGDGRARRRAGRRSSGSRPSLGGHFSFEHVGQRGRRGLVARRAGASKPAATTGPRSSGWRARSAGCRCTSGSTSSTGAGTAMAAAAAAGWRRSRASSVLTPAHAMATLVTFRIAGWPAQAALDELGSRVFAIARTIASLDALRISVGFFNYRGRARAFRRGGRAARRAHARDAAAAPRRWRSWASG